MIQGDRVEMAHGFELDRENNEAKCNMILRHGRKDQLFTDGLIQLLQSKPSRLLNMKIKRRQTTGYKADLC
jgi:hypothetical protein